VNPIGAIAYNYSGNELTYVSELENVDMDRAQNIDGDVDQTIYIEFRNTMYGELMSCSFNHHHPCDTDNTQSTWPCIALAYC
jgi:hypothetical protein